MSLLMKLVSISHSAHVCVGGGISFTKQSNISESRSKVYWHITEILTRRFSERSDDDSNSHYFLLLYIYKCRPLQSINVFSVFFRSFFFVCSSHSRTISSILYASVTYPRLEDVCLSKSVSKRDDSRAIANGESENVRKTLTKCTT